MTALLTALAAVLTAIYVAAPFWRARREAAEGEHQTRRDELELRRESLLRDLKELEFDHRMGKIDDSEYQTLRSEAAADASAVLNQLEALRPRPTAATPQPSARWGLDIEIEVLVARARRRLQAASTRLSVEKAGWVCECGRAMGDSDRFCAACGAARPIEKALQDSLAENAAS